LTLRGPLAALAVACALAACAGDRAQLGAYAGVYRAGFETQAFWPASGDGPYWVDGDAAALGALDVAVRRANGGSPWGGISATVQGELSPAGRYGHLGAYTHALHVKRVVTTRPLDESAGARG